MKPHPFTKKGQKVLKQVHLTVKQEHKRMCRELKGEYQAFLVNNGIVCPIQDNDTMTLILHGALAERVYEFIKQEAAKDE